MGYVSLVRSHYESAYIAFFGFYVATRGASSLFQVSVTRAMPSNAEFAKLIAFLARRAAWTFAS
jgi:hypothetical protein